MTDTPHTARIVCEARRVSAASDDPRLYEYRVNTGSGFGLWHGPCTADVLLDDVEEYVRLSLEATLLRGDY